MRLITSAEYEAGYAAGYRDGHKEATEDRTDWQPIETAPNGVALLIHFTSGHIDLVFAEDNDYEWKRWDGQNYSSRGIDTPTHWMPLPPPPESNT